MTVDALQLLKTEQYDTGFVAGYEKATKETANYPRLKDPSYKQVLSLIKGNVCDRCGVDSKVRCQYASACLINSAKDAGYKSHLVIISDYEALSHHALVCFDTVDKGKVYVEPQVNKTVAVVVGKHYEYLDDFMVSEIVHFP
jgi:hypothetical protein